jgi:FkbM family methyltransferase
MEELRMEVGLAGPKRCGFEPGVIFDVGAAAGDWARMALGLWPRALVYCFEPLQERWAQIEALARDFQGQVQLLPIGLGDTDAKLSIGVTEFPWDSSSSYGGATSRQIDVHRPDTLLEEGRIVPPSLVKLDVQGFERKVLTGGERALAQTDAIIECSFFSFCDDVTTLDGRR